jgi:hypothetical protein
MALKRVWIPSQFYSSRGGASVRLIVVHTAEGATTIESLGSWFQNPSAQCSSHAGADDKVNTIGEYVDQDKAWTQADYNPVAVSIELCGFAAWTASDWAAHPNMLDNCAKWIAEEAKALGIPITKLSASEAQGSGRGVCQHADLGAGGGGHWDCGSSFPMDDVLDMARGGGQPAPSITEGEMIASGSNAGDTPHVFWVGSNHQEIYYRWKSDGHWQGGNLFAKTSKDVTGLSCVTDAGGNFNVFARLADGNVRYTWQAKGKGDWNGKGSTPAGLIAFP